MSISWLTRPLPVAEGAILAATRIFVTRSWGNTSLKCTQKHLVDFVLVRSHLHVKQACRPARIHAVMNCVVVSSVPASLNETTGQPSAGNLRGRQSSCTRHCTELVCTTPFIKNRHLVF